MLESVQRLVEDLLSKTRTGRVDWRPALSGQYQVSFPRYSVRIERDWRELIPAGAGAPVSLEFYRLAIIDSHGQRISDVRAEDPHSSDWALLTELHLLASHGAHDVDEAVSYLREAVAAV